MTSAPFPAGNVSLIRRVSLNQWTFIAMILGVLCGSLFPNGSQHLAVFSTIFLRLIQCIIVPIIFSTLVGGIAAHSDDLKSVARLALKSLIYFEVVTTLALAVGLGAVNVLKPGAGVNLEFKEPAKTTTQGGGDSQPVVEHIVPRSFFESAAHNDVLGVVIFSVIFGLALIQVRGQPRETMLNFFEGLSRVMFKFTGLVMKLAPLAVGAAMAVTVGRSGTGILANLGKLLGTLYVALVFFLLLVGLPIVKLCGFSARKFGRAIKGPALIAFSTASSEAALPLALENMVEFGVPKRIVSFVLPAGYSFNLDGTTLYLAVALLFVAQAAGAVVTPGRQLEMMLTLMLASKGLAGVPRAAQALLSAALVNFGLPMEGMALILGVDSLMDMARSAVNVIGNCLASAAIWRWEGGDR